MKSRTIEKKAEIEKIIMQCDVCYIGMVDKENKPYVLPFNFGYKDDVFYFHSAPIGKKIDILQDNKNVCVVFSTNSKLRWSNEEVACSYGMNFKSILAYGKVEFVEDFDEKVDALNVIMSNYSEREFTYNKPAVKGVKIWKVLVDKYEGKALGV